MLISLDDHTYVIQNRFTKIEKLGDVVRLPKKAYPQQKKLKSQQTKYYVEFSHVSSKIYKTHIS